MTEAIYLEVKHKTVETQKERRVSVSGMLLFLGVSRSGYSAWIKRKPSKQAQRKHVIKTRIQKIYDDSYQNYGAPKITKELQKSGEKISERTISKYMKEMHIKAQYMKPYTMTTKDSDFSSALNNVLNENFNRDKPNTAWCTDITYI